MAMNSSDAILYLASGLGFLGLLGLIAAAWLYGAIWSRAAILAMVASAALIFLFNPTNIQ